MVIVALAPSPCNHAKKVVLGHVVPAWAMVLDLVCAVRIASAQTRSVGPCVRGAARANWPIARLSEVCARALLAAGHCRGLLGYDSSRRCAVHLCACVHAHKARVTKTSPPGHSPAASTFTTSNRFTRPWFDPNRGRVVDPWCVPNATMAATPQPKQVWLLLVLSHKDG